MIEAVPNPSPTTPPETRRGVLRFVPSLYLVTLLAILGAVLVVAIAPRLDTDFWWHLKVGQYIALQHKVPAHDFMSYTLTGHSWTDHEWLAELTLYGLYRLAGLWGPIAFFSLVICATFFCVYRVMAGYRLNRVLSLFLMAAAFIASSASWGPRIQMLTLFFLSVFMLLLQRYGETRDRRILFAFPALMLIWANVHGGFVLGLAAMVLTLGGEWLNRKTKHASSWSTDDLKALLYTLLGTIAVTIINPNGFRQLLYPLTFVLPNAYTNLIEESASPNFHLPILILFEGLLLLLVTAFAIDRPRLNWTHLFVVLAFTHLALSQVRNVAVWAVVVSPLVAFYVNAALPALRTQFPRLSYESKPMRGRAGPVINLVLLVLIPLAYVLEGTHFVNAQALRQAESDQYPRAAIAYMQSHNLPQHVFASYSWGGYLLWNLFPKYRDYMDSRADTLFTNAILHDYLTMYAGKPGWEGVLRRRGVDVVLVERTAPLSQLLALDPAWKLNFHDSLSVLYVRRAATSA